MKRNNEKELKIVNKERKKLWTAPELIVLDLKKTSGGGNPASPEDDEYEPNPTGSGG